LSDVSAKSDLSFQLTWFSSFFEVFRGFLGYKTSGNLNDKLLMQSWHVLSHHQLRSFEDRAANIKRWHANLFLLPKWFLESGMVLFGVK